MIAFLTLLGLAASCSATALDALRSSPNRNYLPPSHPNNLYLPPTQTNNQFIPPSPPTTPRNVYLPPTTPNNLYLPPSPTLTPKKVYSAPQPSAVPNNLYLPPQTPNNVYFPPSAPPTPNNRYLPPTPTSTPKKIYQPPPPSPSPNQLYLPPSSPVTPNNQYLPPSPGVNSYSTSGLTGAVFRQQLSSNRPSAIVRQVNENNGDGIYTFSYETEDGIVAEERGQLRSGDADDIQSAQGSFSFTAPDNVRYTVTYTADENGFQPQGAHLPVPPPIPEAILKALADNAADEARGIVDDGSYKEESTNSGYQRGGFAAQQADAGYYQRASGYQRESPSQQGGYQRGGPVQGGYQTDVPSRPFNS